MQDLVRELPFRSILSIAGTAEPDGVAAYDNEMVNVREVIGLLWKCHAVALVIALLAANAINYLSLLSSQDLDPAKQ